MPVQLPGLGLRKGNQLKLSVVEGGRFRLSSKDRAVRVLSEVSLRPVRMISGWHKFRAVGSGRIITMTEGKTGLHQGLSKPLRNPEALFLE